ncbi:MAG TPA: PilZ domain-containing protein [Pirellulaceae bacterium]|nr:PilZ domain-containing protein [Pirellulaceae bacterium]
MLDHDCHPSFGELIDAAPNRLQVPATLLRALSVAERHCQFDQRQSPRIPLMLKGAADVSSTLPAFPRGDIRGRVIVCDASLRGMRFLFDQQLWPGERVRLLLPESQFTGEVARARRLQPHCYEIGVRLDAALSQNLIRQFLSQQRLP